MAVSIRALERVLCDALGAEQGPASRWMRAVGVVPAATRGSVAIIGAGPAGLVAAHDLRASGFGVTVCESMPVAGGMMRYGIPGFRLPHDVLQAEIDAIASLGVEIRLGCAIGRDVLFADLLAEHDAVLVTVGSQLGRTTRVPGVELPGVVRAVDFLRTGPTNATLPPPMTTIEPLVASDSAESADVARVNVAAVFATRCAACHGAGGKGSAIAPSVRPVREALAQQPEEIFTIVARGVPGKAMSGFARTSGGPLDETTVRALVAWMLRTGVTEAPSVR